MESAIQDARLARRVVCTYVQFLAHKVAQDWLWGIDDTYLGKGMGLRWDSNIPDIMCRRPGSGLRSVNKLTGSQDQNETNWKQLLSALTLPQSLRQESFGSERERIDVTCPTLSILPCWRLTVKSIAPTTLDGAPEQTGTGNSKTANGAATRPRVPTTLVLAISPSLHPPTCSSVQICTWVALSSQGPDVRWDWRLGIPNNSYDR
ncbi:hypothetical protein VTK26DRAFT_7146 [Humicola hyalothermophila]